VDHLLFVLPGKITSQGHHTGGELLLDAAAGRAQFFADTLEPRHPLPAPLVIDHTALRTHRTLMELLLTLVRIENVILLGASRDSA
jgi:hypothetical protein